MPSWRVVNEIYTETKRVVEGEVVQTVCCCSWPGAARRDCAAVSGNRSPCRCACHAGVLRTVAPAKKSPES
jgi:hypothetical protein